jgi:cyclopropane-fatty-acyl-phospholipid synthase
MRRLFDAIFRRLVSTGRLVVHWPDGGATLYGNTEVPRAAFRLRDSATVRRIALDPGMGFGEAYMDGGLEPVGCTIYDVLDVLMINLDAAPPVPMLDGWQAVRRVARRAMPHSARRLRRTVTHYEIDETVYRQFLDRDMQYSCAYFAAGDETLEQAQAEKKRHIAAKLKLDRPGLSVLDIGCGWGGMALTLARDFGARVTGITLAHEQLRVARERAAAEGLADLVSFRLQDYRDVPERFDRVVSVGMLEHVGRDHYAAYFRAVRERLAPDGVALIHCVGRSEGPGETAAWLQKYIFPDGYSPALSELAPYVEKAGLVLTDLEVLRLHYAKTIRLWRERFAARRDSIAAMADERFCRMFEFYLAAVELAFRRQGHVTFQLQLARGIETLPLTRDYMMEGSAEAQVFAQADALQAVC